MREIERFVLITCITAFPAIAEDYCSLRVRVLSPDGSLAPAVVSVEEADGRRLVRSPNADSTFCDLGAKPVTVKVGADGTCNQVVVRNVPIEWQEPYLLTVMQDRKPCLWDPPPSPVPVCTIVYRISDSKGWVGGAKIRVIKPFEENLTTDGHGRAAVKVRERAEVLATITSGNARSENVSCHRAGLRGPAAGR